jgi:hypothetical protein
VAGFCFSVFETAIDTILLSFCEDMKLNADAHSYYMSIELQHFIDKNAVEEPPPHLEKGANRSRRGQKSNAYNSAFHKLPTHDDDATSDEVARVGEAASSKQEGGGGKSEKRLDAHMSFRSQVDV